MKKWNTVCISVLIFTLFNVFSLTFSQSLFDSLENSNNSQAQAMSTSSLPNISHQEIPSSNIPVQHSTPEPILQPKYLSENTQPQTTIISDNNEDMDQNISNLNNLIEKMKDKVENPALKNNLNLESISNFFANVLSGNEILNNLEVKKLSHVNKIEIGEKLKSEGEAEFNSLKVKENFVSKVFNITDDRITFNPEASIKMSNSKLLFKVKDIFEVITFMKYIVKVCGSRLERCDFGNLLSNNQQDTVKNIMKLIEERQKEISKVENDFKQQLKENNNKTSKSNLRKNNKAVNSNKDKNNNEDIDPNIKFYNNDSNNNDSNNNNNNNKMTSYMFRQKQIMNNNKDNNNILSKPNNDLFDHQSEIEKELNLQLKLYKEKQKQELFENSYNSFLNKDIMSNEEQTLNDYYYNLDMNFLV